MKYKQQEIVNHYEQCWRKKAILKYFDKGPRQELPKDFSIAIFEPDSKRQMWTYATCGMSCGLLCGFLELHLFSPIESNLHIELLTTIAHYHQTGQALDLGHTVNFGRPWLNDSLCEYGLISLPYLDGPSLENLKKGNMTIRCLWLIPITKSEVEFKKQYGLDLLEEQFEKTQFNYLDINRRSVV